MVIDFLCNVVTGGWDPTDDFLRGTEDSLVQWSKRLVQRDHTVTVYHNSRIGHYGDFAGVSYKDRVSYTGNADICINIKSSDIAPKCKTLYLTTETNANQLDLSAYAGVIWPTKWAVDNIPVNNKTFILPYGYDKATIYPGKKIAKQCFYASSPDRGLNILLNAWPKVYAAHPDATLLLTYGVTGISYPGVIPLGNANEETMDGIYQTSSVWCHPCIGGETFCITGIKAQAAQCVPVVIPTMALAETVKHGVFTSKENYANDLINLLSHHQNIEQIRMDLAQEHYVDWEESTDMLLDLIQQVLKLEQ